MEFKDKVILVTGGSSGIGAAICDKFYKLGAKVVVLNIKECKKEYEYFNVDIRKRSLLKRLFQN